MLELKETAVESLENEPFPIKTPPPTTNQNGTIRLKVVCEHAHSHTHSHTLFSN